MNDLGVHFHRFVPFALGAREPLASRALRAPGQCRHEAFPAIRTRES